MTGEAVRRSSHCAMHVPFSSMLHVSIDLIIRTIIYHVYISSTLIFRLLYFLFRVLFEWELDMELDMGL